MVKRNTHEVPTHENASVIGTVLNTHKNAQSNKDGRTKARC